MTTPKDDFYLKVAHALSGCQLVEQDLKLYITEALGWAKLCIGRKVPFKMRGEDYANLSLGQLIHIFQKLSDDETLVEELKTFVKARNFLSHASIAYCLDRDGELDYGNMSKFQDQLAAIAPEAERLRRAIYEQRAVLGFDIQ